MTRLQEHYRKTVVPKLSEKFGYKNPMQVPRITKITLNMGVGEAVADKKVMDAAVADLTKKGDPFPLSEDALLASITGIFPAQRRGSVVLKLSADEAAAIRAAG